MSNIIPSVQISDTIQRKLDVYWNFFMEKFNINIKLNENFPEELMLRSLHPMEFASITVSNSDQLRIAFMGRITKHLQYCKSSDLEVMNFQICGTELNSHRKLYITFTAVLLEVEVIGDQND